PLHLCEEFLRIHDFLLQLRPGLDARQSVRQRLRERRCSGAQFAVFRDKAKPRSLSEGKETRVVSGHTVPGRERQCGIVRHFYIMRAEEAISLGVTLLARASRE